MERDAVDTANTIERAKKFVKLVKQLDEKQQRALLFLIKSADVLGVQDLRELFGEGDPRGK